MCCVSPLCHATGVLSCVHFLANVFVHKMSVPSVAGILSLVPRVSGLDSPEFHELLALLGTDTEMRRCAIAVGAHHP